MYTNLLFDEHGSLYFSAYVTYGKMYFLVIQSHKQKKDRVNDKYILICVRNKMALALWRR